LAIARAFAAEGAKVHICDIAEKALRALTQAEPSITATVCDVSDRPAVERLVKAAADTPRRARCAGEQRGHLRADRAGGSDGPGCLGGCSQDQSHRHIQRDQAVDPPSQAVGIRRHHHHVVARRAVRLPDRSPYATTKWGLIGFTKTLSIELGEFGIRVNAILPGAVEGPRIQRVFEGTVRASGKPIAEVTKEALANQSIKRFVHPQDIAALALFLASESGRSMSGQMLPIDGDSQAAG
jgi:NAD(P)-dependent dehydrogenase (short-subunit alcohol dehydrogenase family)